MERITRIAPSARLEEQINELLSGGLGEDGEHLERPTAGGYATSLLQRRRECDQTKPHPSRRCNSFPAKAQPASRNRVLRRAR
jgi:hypothetical protein